MIDLWIWKRGESLKSVPIDAVQHDFCGKAQDESVPDLRAFAAKSTNEIKDMRSLCTR